MTKRLNRGTGPRSPVTSRLTDRLPVVLHRPIDEAKLAAFAHWMDSELEVLERRFQHFTTPRSLIASLRR